MGNRLIKFSILIAVTSFISLGFTSKKTNVLENKIDPNTEETVIATVQSEEEYQESVKIPFLGKNVLGFREAVAFKESQGNYLAVNTLGYLGKYQFGKGTLELIGIRNIEQFMNNPILQEKAFIANMSRNKWILRKDIARFVGKKINNVEITESGILAAAHLAGPGNVKKYLRSGGSRQFSDAYGSTLSYYLKRFSGYNTSEVVAKKNARV